MESAEGRAAFANPEHNDPQRTIYSREAEGSLCPRIEGERDGHLRASSWIWQHADFPAAGR